MNPAVVGSSHELNLQNEIPKFRSGFRTVTVTKISGSFVWLTCGSKKAKVAKDIWVTLLVKKIKKEHRALTATPRRRRF